MAGTTASELVFFIVSVLVASMVAATLTSVVVDISEGIKSKGGTISDSLETSVIILNDPKAMPYNASTGNLTVYIRNVGMTPLHANSTVFHLQGGSYSGDYSSSGYNVTFIPAGANDWLPDVIAVYLIHTSPPLTPGEDYTLTAWVEYGVSSSISFRV